MKVIGLGAPDSVRVCFDACEVHVLVDVLRAQRADTTRDAAQTYATAPGQTRAVDDRHDRLEAELVELMRAIFEASDGNYGVPRMHRSYAELGWSSTRRRCIG